MENQVAKSKFKPHALQYFREVERTGRALIITDRDKPVLKITPYSEKPSETLKMLREKRGQANYALFLIGAPGSLGNLYDAQR